MRKVIDFCRWMRGALSRIHLVDKCLIIFMTVLLLQLSYGLIFHNHTTDAANDFDVIIRTSAAAIFGYFLSANFVRNSKEVNGVKITEARAGIEETDVAVVEQTENLQETALHSEQMNADQRNADQTNADHPQVSKLQVVIATVVGLFCLFVLIILRNIGEFMSDWSPTNGNLATISQFRDFISGCVGFLIGCPTSQPPKK